MLPLFAALEDRQQSTVFEACPDNFRKCIVATNIAETSLTIHGVKYVIDAGFQKRDFYDPVSDADTLVVTPISKMTAQQRAGRAGRTAPGTCFRLYTELAFQEECHDQEWPTMQRCNLVAVLLQIKALGVSDVTQFDWVDAPAPDAMLRALQGLLDLGALDDDGALTRLGTQLLEFPMDPELAVALLRSGQHGCSVEVGMIAAMVNADVQPFGTGLPSAALQHPLGDHFTLLCLYHRSRGLVGAELLRFCDSVGANPQAVLHARQALQQLTRLLQRLGVPCRTAGRSRPELVVRALLEGYGRRVARRAPGAQGTYTVCSSGQEVFLHPGSPFLAAGRTGPTPEWVFFHRVSPAAPSPVPRLPRTPVPLV